PAAYRALYRSANGAIARGDASVSTLYYATEALDNLDRYFPDARLAVVFRDPVARAFSAYSYVRVRGFEPAATFMEALAEEKERIRSGWHHLWHYVEMGRYAAQLRPFIERRGPDRLKIFFYENFQMEPERIARELFEFLDIDAGATVDPE